MAQHFVSEGRCQFCHETAGGVEHLVAGGSGFICNACVEACAVLIRRQEVGAPARVPSERFVFQRLARHFASVNPQELLATSRSFSLRQQADLQAALDELFGERAVPATFLGIRSPYRHEATDFAKLLDQGHGRVEIAPAQFEDIDIGGGETRRCLKNGLWLLLDGERPYAVVLSRLDPYGDGGSLHVEVAVLPDDAGVALASRILEAIERSVSRSACYRGRVLSLESSEQWHGRAGRILVHELEPVHRDEVILPEPTLRAVERNVLRFAEQRPALRAMGLSTQKGLLFHGPPGTGKTHCIRYLAGQLEGHTTLLLTAEQVALLPEYMALARVLQPALVVLEDADLVARNRADRSGLCDEALLNRLLNELDGLREKADVFVILTTNRPDSLEPALASRPGRIDQAIEFALPDETHRRRLIALYGPTLTMPPSLIDDLARRTDGASPAFIKEFLRRIAQHHLDAHAEGAVTQETAEAALHEMLFSGGALNARLLGGEAVSEDAVDAPV